MVYIIFFYFYILLTEKLLWRLCEEKVWMWRLCEENIF